MEEKKCFCEEHWLEKDDVLYAPADWDGGYGYERIRIKFCPVCGKELPEERKFEE